MQSQSHVRWECNYHIVIVPKYRKKVLYGAARKEMIDIIQTLAKQKGIEVIRGNAVVDHFHMLVSIPPKFSVAHSGRYPLY